jgi:hypothetical protein
LRWRPSQAYKRLGGSGDWWCDGQDRKRRRRKRRPEKMVTEVAI